MAILLRELHFQGEVGRDALDIIVAGYLSCRKLVSSSGKVELDDFLAKACREFTPVNFEYVLGLLDEALVAAPSMAADLVHLALVLLGNHPHSQSLPLALSRRLLNHVACRHLEDYAGILHAVRGYLHQ